MKLEPSEIELFVNNMIRNNGDLNGVHEYLVSKGMNDYEIKISIKAIKYRYAKRLEEIKHQAKIDGDYENVGSGIAYIISACVCYFTKISLPWIFISVIALGALGYYTIRSNRIVGAVAMIVFFLIYAYVFPIHFAGRETIFKIELLIIGILCGIPSILMVYIAKTIKV